MSQPCRGQGQGTLGLQGALPPGRLTSTWQDSVGVVQGAPLERDNNGDDGMSTQENYVVHLGSEPRMMLCWAPPSCLSPLLGAVAATAWVPRQLVTVVEWAEGSCPCRVEALAHLPFTQSLHEAFVGREEGTPEPGKRGPGPVPHPSAHQVSLVEGLASKLLQHLECRLVSCAMCSSPVSTSSELPEGRARTSSAALSIPSACHSAGLKTPAAHSLGAELLQRQPRNQPTSAQECTCARCWGPLACHLCVQRVTRARPGTVMARRQQV